MKNVFHLFYVIESAVMEIDVFTQKSSYNCWKATRVNRFNTRSIRGQAFCLQAVLCNICTFRHTTPDLTSHKVMDCYE